MGQGLGKESPVVLTLGKENYEALISRHGQFIRWRTATKCPCTLQDTEQTDIHCKRCGGRGVIYGFQPKMSVTQTVMADIEGIIEVADEFTGCALDFVYDFNGVHFKNAKKYGKYIQLNPESPINKGDYVYVVMTKDTVSHVKKAACEKLGAGYYRVGGLRSRRAGIDGLYHTAPGDIEKIGKIVDGAGIEYEAKEYRTDLFLIEPKTPEGEMDTPPAITEPVTAYDIEYVPPFLFAIMNQELSKADEAAMVENHGQAIITFPYACDVAEDDVLTVLSGTNTRKDVTKRISGADDTIGAFFVQEIVSCLGKERDYQQGVDFLLTGANRIKWLCEDAPEPDEAYSITYKENPTYIVAKSIPQLRTSENQRMPKKAVVTLHTSYAEKKRVNVQ